MVGGWVRKVYILRQQTVRVRDRSDIYPHFPNFGPRQPTGVEHTVSGEDIGEDGTVHWIEECGLCGLFESRDRLIGTNSAQTGRHSFQTLGVNYRSVIV